MSNYRDELPRPVLDLIDSLNDPYRASVYVSAEAAFVEKINGNPYPWQQFLREWPLPVKTEPTQNDKNYHVELQNVPEVAQEPSLLGAVASSMSGFCMLIDSVRDALGLEAAAVYGAIRRYCQMTSGVCFASLDTIAHTAGVSKSTAIRKIKILCKDGYVEDTTPGRRNNTHVYRLTSKVKVHSRVVAE